MRMCRRLQDHSQQLSQAYDPKEIELFALNSLYVLPQVNLKREVVQLNVALGEYLRSGLFEIESTWKSRNEMCPDS